MRSLRNTHCPRGLVPGVLIALALSWQTSASQRHDDFEPGLVYVLEGNYTAAREVADRLIETEGARGDGYTLMIDALGTELSFDERQDHIDKPLRENIKKALAHCRERLRRDETDALAHADCGIAHINLSYLSALRGRYIAAGNNGQKGIDQLEAALADDPDFTDVKMHLGLAYYYAENLPPFIKAISPFLWFIPTGDATRALPYIREVIESGDDYDEVTKFIYADLLAQHDNIDDRREAVALLDELSASYPGNARLHLAHITHRLLAQDADGATRAMARFRSVDKAWSDSERALMEIWYTRALLEAGQAEAAIASFEKYESLVAAGAEIPFWNATWEMLARAQVLDLKAEREAALAAYRRALALNKRYPNAYIRAVVEAGLAEPYAGDASGGETARE